MGGGYGSKSSMILTTSTNYLDLRNIHGQNAFMDSSQEIEDCKMQIELARKMIEQLEDNAEYRSATDILFRSADRLLAEFEATNSERQYLLDEIERLEC
jgi:hypothetical protein